MSRISYLMPCLAMFAVAVPPLAAQTKVAKPSASDATDHVLDVDDPPHGRFSDDWLEIYLMGGKIGYGHSTMSRDGSTIETKTEMRMRMGRVDMPVSISMTQSTREKLDGTPLSFKSEMNAATMKTRTAGTIKDGKVTIVTSQFGMDQTQAFDFQKGSLMTWGLFRETIVKGLTPGNTFTTQTFAPEFRLDGAVEVVVRVGDWEEYQHHGTQRGLRVMTAMDSPMGRIEMTSWVDRNGVPQKAMMPVPGLGDLLLYAVDEEVALADFVPPEMFMTSTVKADLRIDRANVETIEYRISAKNATDIGTFPETSMQKVSVNAGGSVSLVVSRQPHEPVKTQTSPLSPKELAEFTGSNLMINIEDPELVALAKKAGAGERDPYILADRLRLFVTEYITDKNLSVAFATASEVCRKREGDCSEHGVLLAALGRINGLPSRVVAGLAYVPLFGQQQDIFGYHMWTQFYIDGRWIDVDAALRETQCSPARIAMATSSLRNSGMADLSLPLLSKIGSIDVDIVKIDGKPSNPDR